MTAWEVTTLSMVAGVWPQFWIFWQLAADWLLDFSYWMILFAADGLSGQ